MVVFLSAHITATMLSVEILISISLHFHQKPKQPL